MKNILVVGGAGYIGGALTDLLISLNQYNVRVYDNLLYEESFRKDVDFVYGDIRDHELLKSHLNWADAVVWLAAIVGDGACQINSELTVEVNQKEVKWLSENYDGRIIFMSTCSVYGAQNEFLNERSVTNPLSLYAATKLKAEEYLHSKNSIIFRLGTLFGIGDNYSRVRLDLVVNVLTVRAYLNNKISVFGGDQFRPLLHVKDVARAIEKNIHTSVNGIYNLAYKNMKIIDLAHHVVEYFPHCEIETTDIPFQDTRNYRVSFDKAEEAFGFDCICSIDDGVKEVKKLIAENRIKDVEDIRYSNHLFLKHKNPMNIWSTRI